MKKQPRIPRELRQRLHGPAVLYYDQEKKRLVLKQISRTEYEQAVQHIKEKAAS